MTCGMNLTPSVHTPKTLSEISQYCQITMSKGCDMIALPPHPQQNSSGWSRAASTGLLGASHKTWLTLPRGIASQQVMIMLY